MVILARFILGPGGRMSGCRVRLMLRLTRLVRRRTPPRRGRVPVALLLRRRRRPAGGLPPRRRTVVGLRRSVIRVVATGRVRAVAVGIGALLGMHGAGRGDRLLEGGLGGRLRPRLATLDGKLARGLDGRFVRRNPPTEVVEHRQARTFLDTGEDHL